MRKIQSLFQRNHDSDRLVRDEVVAGSEWVSNGEGVATQKFDGTCCMIRSGVMFKRYEVKPNGKPPIGFEPANEIDEATGKQQGWVKVGDGPEDKWHREAVQTDGETPWSGLADGTYELCGPKINGNPEGLMVHMLIPHGYAQYPHFPRTYTGIKDAFENGGFNIEGVVWHHPDGRMVKIKAKDFGLKRSS